MLYTYVMKIFDFFPIPLDLSVFIVSHFGILTTAFKITANLLSEKGFCIYYVVVQGR